jgi:hypothetical protein
MKDRTTPGKTAEPWTHSVDSKEQQGSRRDADATQKLKSDKEARRRDDKSQERGQDDPPTGTTRAEDIFKKPTGSERGRR